MKMYSFHLISGYNTLGSCRESHSSTSFITLSSHANKIIVKCTNYDHKVCLSKRHVTCTLSYLILSLPNISFASVALPVNHFRTHPVGGASDRLDAGAGHADGLDAFAGAKVAQLYVP